MSVDQIQATTAAADTRTFIQPDILGKEDFLTLLVTQLENQDPLQPMQDQEFIAQLAQFSSLEQLRNLGTSIASLLSLQESSINAMSVGLIGKTARVYANTVDTSLMEGPIKFELYPPKGENVHVRVFDSKGYVVYSQDIESTEGVLTFEWDGTDGKGNVLPDGRYTVEAQSSLDVTGNYQKYPIFVVGEVRSIDFSSGRALVNVNGVIVDLTQVVEVRDTVVLPDPDPDGDDEEKSNPPRKLL